jgi:hypothetical protein
MPDRTRTPPRPGLRAVHWLRLRPTRRSRRPRGPGAPHPSLLPHLVCPQASAEDAEVPREDVHLGRVGTAARLY